MKEIRCLTPVIPEELMAALQAKAIALGLDPENVWVEQLDRFEAVNEWRVTIRRASVPELRTTGIVFYDFRQQQWGVKAVGIASLWRDPEKAAEQILRCLRTALRAMP